MWIYLENYYLAGTLTSRHEKPEASFYLATKSPKIGANTHKDTARRQSPSTRYEAMSCCQHVEISNQSATTAAMT